MKFFTKILDRLKEPSSAAGLSAIILGSGSVFKINEAPEVATVVADTVAGLQVSPIAAGFAFLTGLYAILRGEKKA